jgi:signal transduction histidine kinase
MPTSQPDSVVASQARQPRNPISRRQIETVIGRSSGILGLVFGAQTFPTMLGQSALLRPPWSYVLEIAVYGGLLLSLIASIVKRFVRPVNAYIAFAYLAALISWPFLVTDPSTVATDRPWLWFLCTVATATAAVAFSAWMATVYLVIAPVIYGIIRTTPSGGGASVGSAGLDTAYAIILGGAVLIIITLLRQAAAAVDAAQATALDRYAHAVRQHATEVERVQVDAIVHDSVLTTLLSAARAYTPEAKELATRMARNAMGHLKDAAAASPDDDATVSLDQLAHRIMGATATLSAPFELRSSSAGDGVIPVQSAEAVYSAAVQAMVNSLQHAGQGPDIKRWLTITPRPQGGVQVDIGDTGAGFAIDAVPTERLGLRVSILERVANAGGIVDIHSTAGEGTVISIRWPHPQGAGAVGVLRTAEVTP